MTERIMVQMSKDILIRFINNTCSDDELQAVKCWLDESEENVNELFELEKTAMLASCLNDGSGVRERVYANVRQKIINRRLQDKSSSRKLVIRWASAAAAVAVIVITSIFLFRAPEVKMLKAIALTESRSVTLPDGSTVYLNIGSQLEYPETFASVRKVSLTGEGFFKVSHDSDHPFIVEGEYLNVKVLGTQFNFNSNEDGENNVSLVEGSVEVSTSDNKGGVVLAPGQKADYDSLTGSINVVETNAPVDAAWHNKVIPFNNATFKEIAEILEQLYKVDIVLDKNIYASKTYSGSTVFYGSIDSTLTQLCNTLPIEYSSSGSQIIIRSKSDW